MDGSTTSHSALAPPGWRLVLPEALVLFRGPKGFLLRPRTMSSFFHGTVSTFCAMRSVSMPPKLLQ